MKKGQIDALGRLPQVILRPDIGDAARPARLLTPVYGTLRRSFSGSTWYLAQAAMAQGGLDGAFSFEGKTNLGLRLAGAAWKLGRIVQGKPSGGFKFARQFHDTIWSRHLETLAGTVILNNTQIYGPTFLRRHAALGISPCFYIDGTLTEYLLGYRTVEQQTMDRDQIDRAIALEREGYRHASKIITMSQATARTLVDAYGVDSARIAMVTPGANIDDEMIPAPSPHTGWVGPEFTLGFVGLFPLRKGLDKLAGAVKVLRGRGKPIRLRIIGRCPPEIAAMDGVDFLGEINKEDETGRFVEAIRTVDLGCQLSRVELLGIAVLEFMRVGVPVLATATGGMLDALDDGGGLLVSPEITVEALVEVLEGLMADPDRYQALRQAAVRRAGWASWRRAASEIDQALNSLD